jgi:hypothetical protein
VDSVETGIVWKKIRANMRMGGGRARGGASQCRKLHSFLPRETRIGCQISVLLWIITRIFIRDGALILKGTVNQVPCDANEVAFAWLNPVAFHAMHGLRFRPSIASFAARR